MLVLKGNIPSLDGIRAFAVLLVFLSHAGLSKVIPGGFGVTIFFFLSGYLITTLLILEHQNRGSISLRNFFIRRVYRLFPPLYFVLIITLFLCLGGVFLSELTVYGLLSQFLQFTNYYILFSGKEGLLPGLGVLWSLAVEEHFYVIYALTFFLVMKYFNIRKLGFFLIISCAIILLWRTYIASGLMNFSSLADVYLYTYYATDTRMDSIMFGCIMAIFINPIDIKRQETSSVKKHLFIICGITCLILTFVYRDSYFRETIRYTIQGIALIPIFYFSITNSESFLFKWLNVKWVRYIGRISYTFYLSHFVCIYLAPRILGNVGVGWNFIFAFVLTILFSSMVYFTIEKYFYKKRKLLSL